MNYTNQLTEIFDKVELLQGAVEAGMDELQQIAVAIGGREPNKIVMMGIVEASKRAEGVFELLNDLEKAIEAEHAQGVAEPTEKPAAKSTTGAAKRGDPAVAEALEKLSDAVQTAMRCLGPRAGAA